MALPNPTRALDAPFPNLLAVVRRQWIIVLSTMVVALGMGVATVVLVPKAYSSNVRLLVDPRPTGGTGSGADVTSMVDLPRGGLILENEVQYLRSPLVQTLAFREANTSLTDPLTKANVTLEEKSSVVNIDVESNDPGRAQTIAAAIPRIYMAEVKRRRQAELNGAIQFIENKLAEEKSTLAQAQGKLRQYKATRAMTPVEGEASVRSSQVVGAETTVEAAQAGVAVAQSRLDGLRRERSRLPAFIEDPVTSTTDSEIKGRREELKELKAKREALLVRYLPDHPDVRQLDAEMAQKQANIATLEKTTSSSTKSPNPLIRDYDDRIRQATIEFEAAQTQLRKSQDFETKAKGRLQTYTEVEPAQKELEKAVVLIEDNVNMLTSQINAFSLRRSAGNDPVQQLNEPTIPELIRPKPQSNFLAAFMIGLVSAMGLALLRDRGEDRLTAPNQIHDLGELMSLGHLPASRKAASALVRPGEPSLLLESVRSLRSNVQFRGGGAQNLKSILVTSTSRGEGKTATACNLATAMAMDGRRVVLIDAHLQRPSIHRLTNTEEKPGLIEILRGERTVDECLQGTSQPGLFVIAAGQDPDANPELLGSENMRKVLEDLRGRFDLTIVDARAMLPATDAAVLANQVDGVLYVAKLEHTKKKAMRYALDLLRMAHANVLGVVFTNTPLGRDRVPTL